MTRHPRLAILVLAAAALTACASATRFRSSWRNPVAQGFRFGAGDKVLAVIVTDDRSLRHSAEASLARALTARGVEGIPSYTIIPFEMVGDTAQARAAAERAGAVGAVAMSAIGEETALSYSLPVYGAGYYGSFWDRYWGWGWGHTLSPGYIRADTLVIVDTLVFDLRQRDALVWAGRSETVDPDDLDPFIAELVDRAARELRKHGLIGQ